MCLFVNSNLSISLMLKSLVLWGLLVLGWSPLCYFDHGTFLKGITHQPIPVFYHRAPFLFNFSDFGLQIHVHPDWVPNKHWIIADVTQKIRKVIKKTLAKTSYKMNRKLYFAENAIPLYLIHKELWVVIQNTFYSLWLEMSDLLKL